MRKCSYCNFYSVPYDTGPAERYSEALLIELMNRMKDRRVRTLYIGGGTPTILPPSFWRIFVDELHEYADTSGLLESTIETNPGVANKWYLSQLRNTGFSRLSIGMQSFNDDLLRLLGRAHDAAQAKRTFQAAREAGFNNISIDLMYGIPGQTIAQWRWDLEQALSLMPEHISCYELTLEPGTPIYGRIGKGELVYPDEDVSTDMYFLAHEMLTAIGYVHYEVSNYAIGNGYSSIHNCSYWERLPYVGLGPSAHSFDGARTRSWNVSSVEDYIRKITSDETAESESEEITPRQEALERIMLGLRCCRGFDPERVMRETGVEVDYQYLKHLIDYERVIRIGARLVPTTVGKLFADGDAAMIIKE